MTQLANDNIRKTVRKKYGRVAESDNSDSGCLVTSCCDESDSDAKATSMELGYSNQEVNEVPDGANMGLGCGNPKTIASLKPGETVLDL